MWSNNDSNPETVPDFTNDDKNIELLYDLYQQQFGALPLLGADKELVFVIGEHEIRETIGPGGSLNFSNLAQLAALTAEDFLSIRLYQNSDMENLLWEFAFEYLALFPDINAGEIEVSADDTSQILYAYLPGYQNRKASQQTPYFLNWRNDNGGTFLPPFERNQDGAFSTTIDLPKTAGTVVNVTAQLAEVFPAITAKSATYKIIPGEAAVISVVQQTGKAAVDGLGVIDVQILVKDAWGNTVEDGTPISITTDSDIEISTTNETLNGLVDIKLTGLETPGLKNLSIQAGAAVTTLPITIEPIDLVITMPAEVNTQYQRNGTSCSHITCRYC